RQGGVTETIIEGRTGIFFPNPTKEEIIRAIKEFEKLKLESADCISQAQKFSKEIFMKKMRAFVEDKYTHQV
ncbi:MAG: glycosyltransferase family 4 protein, partial [Patescibacteria group bacterium]